MSPRGPRHYLLAVLVAALAVLGPLAATAGGHAEREVSQPDPEPFPEYRDTGPSVVVCKPDSRERIASLPAALRERNRALLEECEFEHIQLAIDSVAEEGEPGTRILVLPGVYREEPSREAHDELNGAPIGASQARAQECAQVGLDEQEGGTSTPALSYEEQAKCPHKQNLIAVLGDTTPSDEEVACDGNLCDLQLEGTGARPEDVIVDGKFTTFLNGVKGDRADGLYLTNLLAQHFEFNGVYVLETAGATVDDAVGSFNHEYGFLSFVSYVRYQNCSGQANGDSAFYPGASPNALEGEGLIPKHREDMEFTTEVRGCRGHHNALGYSGTTGNSVFAHHNEFDHNSTGASMDSLFPDHPGLPQNHALFEDNLFHENHVNYYTMYPQKGGCDKPLDQRDYEDGAVCPAVPVPVGTGMILAGGNFNWYHRNDFYDNWRTGTFQFWVPAEIREEGEAADSHFRMACGPDGDQRCPYEETSHWNTYTQNRMADNVPHDLVQPNRVDFTWDLQGEANCWSDNTSAAGGVTYAPADFLAPEDVDNSLIPFPPCEVRDTGSPLQPYSPASTNFLEGPCLLYDPADEPDPPGCDFFDELSVPDGRQPESATLERLGGEDAVATSILASREGYPADAPAVALAATGRPEDALVATPLAHARGGPVLLTRSGGLDPRARAEIERLGASTVYVVGGLSETVVSDLRRMGFASNEIVRLGGENRYRTSAAVARSLPATDAFVANGREPGGAQTAGSVAALLERPILLTRTGSLPQPIRRFLEEGDIEAADIVGGAGSVGQTVESELGNRLDEVERIGGGNRYAVSANLARFALGAGADPTELWLASGLSEVGGVASGSAAAVDEGIVLLCRCQLEGTPAGRWLEEQQPYNPESDVAISDVLERVRVLGDRSFVPAAVTGELKERYGAQPGDARGDRSTGATVRSGAMEGDGAGGQATVTETLVDSTRVEATVSGLEPGDDYEAHVKEGSCSAPGGDLTFDDGHTLHAEFTADPAGVGSADTTEFHVTPAKPGSVQIHDSGGTTVACADLGGQKASASATSVEARGAAQGGAGACSKGDGPSDDDPREDGPGGDGPGGDGPGGDGPGGDGGPSGRGSSPEVSGGSLDDEAAFVAGLGAAGGSGGGGGGTLPFTGLALGALAVLGAVLLGAGALLRRRSARRS